MVIDATNVSVVARLSGVKSGVARFQMGRAAQSESPLSGATAAYDRFEKKGLVIPCIEASDDVAFDPGRAVDQNRYSCRSPPPLALLELVDKVSGLLSEELRQSDLSCANEVEADEKRFLGETIRVIQFGDTHQEADGLQAALGDKAG
jgi:hypothetical protein